jgi:hypothetical protein
MLAKLHADLTTRAIQLRIVEARARVRDLLRAVGLEEQVGHVERGATVDQAIVEFSGSGQPG